jgi:aryl-alcohol dehydrogenase
MKIQAALSLQSRQPLQIEEVELNDVLGPHEILVKNVASGICHSDISMRDAPAGIPLMAKPAVLGHEGSGIVQRVGSAVTTLQPGDHVVMSFHYDGSCPNCQQRMHPYCTDFLANNLMGKRLDGSRAITSPHHQNIAASYHQQSSFATYSIATDHNAVKVPNDLPLELLGPLGCGFLTGAGAVCNRIKPKPGSSFAMFGVGALGFAAIHMAKKAGCSTIIAIDLHESRLQLAREFGATHTINASEVDNTVKALNRICRGGVDYAYEASGSARVMSQAIDSIAPGGTCILSGVVLDPAQKVEFAPAKFMLNKTVGGVLMGHADMPGTIAALIDAVRSGEFPLQKLVKMYEFADINQAMADSERGLAIKAIVRMPRD